jgi:hypothetical protein
VGAFAKVVGYTGTIPDLLLSRTTVRTVGKEGIDNERNSGHQREEHREPFVYVDYVAGKAAVERFVQSWSLNRNQARAFTIADHLLGYGVNGDQQITMGIPGQGGTGKSHLIDAVRS